jgi:hypothetical protein
MSCQILLSGRLIVRIFDGLKSDEPQAVPPALVANLSMLIIPTVPKYWFSDLFTHTGRRSLSPLSPNFCSHNNFTRISLKTYVSFCFPLLDSRTCYLDRVKAKESIDRIKQYRYVNFLTSSLFCGGSHRRSCVSFYITPWPNQQLSKLSILMLKKLKNLPIFLISSYSL